MCFQQKLLRGVFRSYLSQRLLESEVVGLLAAEVLEDVLPAEMLRELLSSRSSGVTYGWKLCYPEVVLSRGCDVTASEVVFWCFDVLKIT